MFGIGVVGVLLGIFLLNCWLDRWWNDIWSRSNGMFVNIGLMFI